MPTIAEITDAATTLSAIAKSQALALIRGSERYKSQVGLYPGLEAKLSAATTVQIQQINAALTLIDENGDGTVALTGGDEALDYDQTRDRAQLVDYMIDTLYESPAPRSGIGVTSMNRLGRCCSRCGCPSWRCLCS